MSLLPNCKAKSTWLPMMGAARFFLKAMCCPRMRYCSRLGATFRGGETTFTLSPSNTPESEEPQLAQANEPDDIAALQQAILAGTDPTQAFEAAAAGGAPAADNIGGVAGASGNGGFVTIDRTGDSTISSAGFDTANPDNPAPLAEVLDDEDELLDLTAPTITVSAPDNTNDNTPTLTGTTDAAPGSTVTLVVTDANGNQQTLTTTVNPDGSFSVDVVALCRMAAMT